VPTYEELIHESRCMCLFFCSVAISMFVIFLVYEGMYCISKYLEMI